MSKHITNDFRHQFSAHFSVRAADGSRMKQQPNGEAHSCPPGAHSTPLLDKKRFGHQTRGSGGLCKVELVGLCAGLVLHYPALLLFSFPLPVPAESVWMAGGLPLPYDWKSWATELGRVPVPPGVGQALLHSCSARSPSATEIGFAKCSQL